MISNSWNKMRDLVESLPAVFSQVNSFKTGLLNGSTAFIGKMC